MSDTENTNVQLGDVDKTIAQLGSMYMRVAGIAEENVPEKLTWAVYPSLENERTKKHDLPGGDDDDWVVTEKIHGANFCVHWVADEKRFRFYTRNHELGGEADFHGFRARKFPWLGAIAEELKEDVLVYGEVYGKWFPGEKGQLVNRGGAVQRGICYSPKLEFIAFDVRCKKGGFWSFWAARAFCKSFGIDFVDVSFIGKKHEAYEFVLKNVDTFKTTRQQPGAENTPYYAPIAEGLVLRHTERHFLVKWRSKEFREVVHGNKSKVHKDVEEEPKKVDDAEPYITVARLNNVRSKMTETFAKENIGAFIRAFALDIEKEMKADGLVFNGKVYNRALGAVVKGEMEAAEKEEQGE